MRKLITAMKVSVDGKVESAQDMADWVEAWSDDYGLTSQIDACVIGGRMYPGYERYWTGIQNEPEKPHPLSGQMPTPAEEVLAEYRERMAGGMLAAQHPRQFGYFTPPPLAMSMMGELLAQIVNQGVDIWHAGPVAAFAEE